MCNQTVGITSGGNKLYWEISARSTRMNSRNATKMVEHKLILFNTKIIPFWQLSSESEAILSKMFRPGHRAGVFIWENFHPGYRDLGRKNRHLGNRASPASHMNTSIFLQRKEWRGEISETEPARLTGLI